MVWRGRALAWLAASSYVAIAAPVLAQAETAAADADFEEIIVTATKRATSIQETPVSVSAFGSDYLEGNNIREFSDFASSIPNVSAPDGLSGTGNVSIRGISSPVRSGSGVEQPVGVYFDGISVDNGALNGLILDIASIEVLRGPQGAIWGRNTPAGAILYTTARPTASLEGFVDGEVGNYDLRQLTGAVSGPLGGEKLLFRLAAGHLERDGFTERRSGGTLGDVNQDLVRASLRFLPTDSLDVTLIAERDWWSGHIGTQEYFTGPFAVQNGTNGFARSVDTDFYPKSDRDTKSLTGIIDYKLGGYTLTSLTGYRSWDSLRAGDTDATNQFLVNEILGEDTEQFSQELRIVSPDDAAFRWIAGLYYFDQRQDSDSQSLIGPAAFGLPPGSQITQRFVSTLDTKSYAAFGQASLDLSEALTLRAGARVSVDDKDIDLLQTVRQFINVPAPVGPIDQTFDIPFAGKYEKTKVTPVFGLDFKPTDDLLFFANAGKGYKAGGFNPAGTVRTTFGPENSTSYEAGVKSEWLDHRLVLNLTAFYVTYDDLQVQSFEGLNPVFVNAGKAKSKGLELEAVARPTEDWLIQAALGLNDAEFSGFVIPAGGPGGTDLDLSDNRLPFAPRVNSTVLTRYSVPLGGDNKAYVQGEWSYSASYWLDIVNDPNGGKQEGFHLLNGRVGFEIGEAVELAVWGRNLTNKDYKVDFVGNLPDAIFQGSKFHVLAAPRTYGIDLRYRF